MGVIGIPSGRGLHTPSGDGDLGVFLKLNFAE